MTFQIVSISRVGVLTGTRAWALWGRGELWKGKHSARERHLRVSLSKLLTLFELQFLHPFKKKES